MQHTTNNWNEYSALELQPVYAPRRYDDNKGNRFYWFDKNGEITPAVGITTMLKSVMPTSPAIIDWQIKYGDKASELLNLTADYGTIMHSCFAELMIYDRYPSPDTITEAKRLLKELKRFDISVADNTIEKNIISFQKFREDFNLKPLLIEASLVAKAVTGDYYCLTLDLLCEAVNKIKTKVEKQDGFWQRGDKKGLPKMVEETTIEQKKELWVIDFKSNWQSKDRKSFFEGHKFQLVAAKKAVRQNFGMAVDRIFNFSPLGWRTKVGEYELKEWPVTDRDTEEFELYEKLASLRGVYNPTGKVEEFKAYEPGMRSEEMYGCYSYKEYVELKVNQ